MADADLIIKVGTQPKNPFKEIQESLKDLDDGISGAINGFKNIGTAVASVAAVSTAFNFVVDSTREMEDLTTQFITFTGSAEGAADQMARLTQYASKSPFALAEVATANRTLLAFGSSAAESVEQLRQIGEISAATGQDLSDLATIFGKIQQTGKLTGETFQQLIERGVNLGPEIARSMGVASTSITELISKSKVSADEVAKSLSVLTNEGGQYFGSTERQAQTLSGSISSLKDNVSILAAEIGGRLTPAMSGTTNAFSDMIGRVTEYLSQQREIASDPTKQRIQSLNEQIDETASRLQNLSSIQSDGGLKKVFSELLFTGGAEGLQKQIDAVTASLAKLTAERAKLIEQQDADAAAKAIEANVKSIEVTQRKANEKELADRLAQQEALREAEEKAAEERKKKILDAEKQITQLTEQETSIRFAKEDLLTEQANQRALEAQKKAAAERLLAEEEAQKGLFIIRSNEQIAEEMRQAEASETQRQQALESISQRESEITTARVQAEATRQELLGQFAEAEALRAEDQQRRITEAYDKGERERLDKIRKAQKDEFNIELQTNAAKKKWDEQTYAERLATAQAGLNALSNLMRSKNREAFEIGKAAATAQALVAIPATAIEAYKSLAGIPLVGPALGAAAAAAAVVAGMEQLRNIQNTRIAFAEGGVVPGFGNKDTVPALLTPGEVVVPKKNFADLEASFVQGAINDDQVALLQAGNNIQAKILDTLTFGVVNEKLTTIISILDSIKSNTFAANSSSTPSQEIIDEAAAERERNAASRRSEGRTGGGGGFGSSTNKQR